MDSVISLLTFFGITPDKYPFLVLGVVVIVCAILVHTSIDKKLTKVDKKLGKVRDNVLVVISHLSTAATNRNKLDTNLIQVMSPMVITEQGHKVLEDSGFLAILTDPSHCEAIMAHLHAQNPNTKLDVENLSILSFDLLLEKDFMNPIKTFLYNNPAMRDSFRTLAGISIRDKYLSEHPEIVE